MSYVLIAVWLLGAMPDAGTAAISAEFGDRAACERAAELIGIHLAMAYRPPLIVCLPQSSDDRK